MSATITSQPQHSNFSSSESANDATVSTKGGYSKPGMQTTGAMTLDSLSTIPELYVKHVLLPKNPQDSKFLPSEYHLMTTAGQPIFIGKEENTAPQEEYDAFNVIFFNTADEEVMSVKKLDTGYLDPCLVEVKPIMSLTSQGRIIGNVVKRKAGGMCGGGDMDLCYEDEFGREGPYYVPVYHGTTTITEHYQIMENGKSVGSFDYTVYERVRRRRGQLVYYKVTFPQGMREAKQKAAIIATVIRMDFNRFCSPWYRHTGQPEEGTEAVAVPQNKVVPASL